MYILDQMFIYIALAIITAIIIDFIVIEGRNDILMGFMVILGAFTGWISFILFAFMTGGIGRFGLWMTLPIILTGLVSIVVLLKFADVKVMFRRPRWRVGKYTTLLSLITLVGLLGSLIIVIFIPVDLARPTPNTNISVFEDVTARGYTDNLEVTSDMARTAGIRTSGNIDISTARTYVNFPRIGANPEEKQYLNFEATFTVSSSGGNWDQPYIRCWIFVDTNENGVPDSNEGFVDPANYKFPSNPQSNGNFWRSHALWENDLPVKMINVLSSSGDPVILPIFRCDLTVWQNELNKVFANTPESFTAPYDMMSWKNTGSSYILEEDVQAWRSLPVGSVATFTGKMYAPEGMAGHYGIVYQTYDMRFNTDPFNPGTPISQKVDAFEILAPDDPDPDPDPDPDDPPVVDMTSTTWVTGVALGGLTLLGSAVAVIKGPKFLMRK